MISSNSGEENKRVGWISGAVVGSVVLVIVGLLVLVALGIVLRKRGKRSSVYADLCESPTIAANSNPMYIGSDTVLGKESSVSDHAGSDFDHHQFINPIYECGEQGGQYSSN